MLTDYHAKYFAYELTKRCPSDSLEKLAGAVAGAQVDLNPHQVLASSTFAIAGALESISNRLRARLKKQEPVETLEEELDRDYEALDATAEEWEEEPAAAALSDADRAAIEAEVADLDQFAKLATSITHNAKVDRQREELIANIEGKLAPSSTLSPLFTLRWTLN